MPLLFLHSTGDVDATGVATVLLAIVTATLAAYTRASVKQAGRELEQSQRPVVVPIADISAGIRPHLAGTGRYALPLKNVGVGPAMDVSVSVEFGDIEAKPTAAPPAWGSAAMTAIGPGETAILEVGGHALQAAMGFAFNVQYHDVSDKAWHSRGAYSEATGLFRNIEVLERALSEASKYRIHFREPSN